jgi:SAM-dependent methyltransferase
MSKEEHDNAIASCRSAVPVMDRPWYRCARRLVDKHSLHGQICLDLCCGNAEFAQMLRDDCGMRVTCADYAYLHVDHAGELGFDTLRVDLDSESAVVDARAMEYAERFDLIVSLATIEHVFASDNFLRFCWKVLKPGGYLLLNTPNISFLGYRLYSIFSGNRPFGEGHHVRFWDLRFLRTNLFLNGLDVIDNGSRFYGVSPDLLARAFKGKKRLASVLAHLFGICEALQHLPGGKRWFADELTVLARKEDTYPIGFQYTHVKADLERIRGQKAERQGRLRLQEALRRGWLREHPLLAGIATGTCDDGP